MVTAGEDTSTIVDAADFTFTGELHQLGFGVLSFSCMRMSGMKVTVSGHLLKPWLPAVEAFSEHPGQFAEVRLDSRCCNTGCPTRPLCL